MMNESRLPKTALFYFSAFLQGLCLVLIPASSFIFKSPEANAITDQQYGLLFLPQIVAAVGVTWFFKPILNRWGTEKVLFLAYLFNGILLFFLWMTNLVPTHNEMSFLFLLACNLFLGLGFGLMVSVLNLLSVDLFPEKRDSILAGLHAFLGIGAAVSPLLVNWSYERESWVLSVWAALVLVAFLATGSFFSRAGRSQWDGSATQIPGEKKENSKESMPPGIVLFLTVIFFYGVAESIVGNWSIVYLDQEKQFSQSVASVSLSTFWMFMTVGRLLASVLVLKIDPRYLYRFSPFFLAAALTANSLNQHESLSVFLYVAIGLGCSYFFPLSISLSSRYFEAWKERLASLAIAALMLGVGVGSSVVGFLRDAGIVNLSQAFLGAMIGILFVAAIAFWLTRHKPEPQA